jgi:hypothetical protein
MGFRMTTDSGQVYVAGTIDLETVESDEFIPINGAVVGFDYNSQGLFGYFGLRLEYHEYVNAL